MSAVSKASIATVAPEPTEWRRDFHRHPELMYEPPRIARLVAERPHVFGFDEVVEGVARSGVLGILHGARGAATSPERRVLFRADMDALPIRGAGRRAARPTPPRCPAGCTPAAMTGTP